MEAFGVSPVAGFQGSLSEAIAQGVVPKPPLVEFNAWQKWRRDHGKRPRTAADGGTTSSRMEADLWRQTMANLYGPEWLQDLAAAGAAEDPSGDGAQEGQRPGAPVPGSGTAAGAASTARLVQTTPRSPGSGDAELAGSWHSSRPGSPAALTARVLAPYDPATGTFDE